MPADDHQVVVYYVDRCYALTLGHTGEGADPTAEPLSFPLGRIENTISTTFIGANSVRLSDIDGDGDPDVVGGAWNDNDIRWWENRDGDGSAWISRNVDLDFSNEQLVIGDIDLDGDDDIVAIAGGESSGLRWWENRVDQVGASLAWKVRMLDPFRSLTTIELADLDGDGDLDIVAADEGPGAIGLVAQRRQGHELDAAVDRSLHRRHHFGGPGRHRRRRRPRCRGDVGRRRSRGLVGEPRRHCDLLDSPRHPGGARRRR